MMYTLDIPKSIQKVIKKWKKSNPILFRKLYDSILPELMEHPRTGAGHPEALVGGNSVTYSRHIDTHNRIVYDIYDDKVVVLVVSIEGHYNDK